MVHQETGDTGAGILIRPSEDGDGWIVAAFDLRSPLPPRKGTRKTSKPPLLVTNLHVALWIEKGTFYAGTVHQSGASVFRSLGASPLAGLFGRVSPIS